MNKMLKLLLIGVCAVQFLTLGFCIVLLDNINDVKVENRELREENYQTKKDLETFIAAVVGDIFIQVSNNIDNVDTSSRRADEHLYVILENVHECAQTIPFVEKARSLCGPGIMQYYCGVVEIFESTCINPTGADFSLPHSTNTSLNEKLQEHLKEYQ